MVQYPALEALRSHLKTQDFRLGTAEVSLAVAALQEYLRSGAALDRRLREDVATFRPVDSDGAALCYLFIVTIDAATHQGRDGALQAYANSREPLAQEAAILFEVLRSPEFLAVRGDRPVVAQRTDGRGCGVA